VRASEIHVQSTKVDHAKPDCSELDHTETNHDLHHQIIKWYLLSSGVLHVAESKFLNNVSGQPTGPIFKQQKIQKREDSMTDVN